MYIKVKRIMGIHAAYDTFGEATEKWKKTSLEKQETKGKDEKKPPWAEQTLTKLNIEGNQNSLD